MGAQRTILRVGYCTLQSLPCAKRVCIRRYCGGFPVGSQLLPRKFSPTCRAWPAWATEILAGQARCFKSGIQCLAPWLVPVSFLDADSEVKGRLTLKGQKGEIDANTQEERRGLVTRCCGLVMTSESKGKFGEGVIQSNMTIWNVGILMISQHGRVDNDRLLSLYYCNLLSLSADILMILQPRCQCHR